MGRRHFSGLLMASALITLDGTATTVALPAMGRDLSASMAWIVNAPLLMLAALLLPAGTLADRCGRGRMIRVGLIGFAAASVACAAAQSELTLIAARFAQGGAGALVLPACLAALRGIQQDRARRTRVFGVWAAWTGAASVAGPLLGGALVDLWSWRAVFAMSAGVGLAALLLLGRDRSTGSTTGGAPIPGLTIVHVIVLLGAIAYVLMHAPAAGLTSGALAWPVALALIAGILLHRDRHRHALLPRELLAAPNCLPANATSFAFYFGMFGVSFLLVLYVQQVLRYSAFWAALLILPISAALLLAGRLARLSSVVGARSLVVLGAVLTAAGIAWMGIRSHPLPVWSHILIGTGLVGFGISLAVSAVTHFAVAAVPDTYAGLASGLNHAVARVAGLTSVALLGSIAAPGEPDMVSADGVQRAMIVCAIIVGIGGVWAGIRLRDEADIGLDDAARAQRRTQPQQSAVLLLRLEHAVERLRRKHVEQGERIRHPDEVCVRSTRAEGSLAAQVHLRAPVRDLPGREDCRQQLRQRSAARVGPVVKPVEDDRYVEAARHRQDLLGIEEPVVVLHHEPPPHGGRDGRGHRAKAIHGQRGAGCVEASYVQNDLGRPIGPEGIEEPRVVLELQYRPPDDRRAR